MKSFVEIPSDCDFSMLNIPYGVFTSPKNSERHIGVAIGELILDLNVIAHLFDSPLLVHHQHVFKESTLNSFMSLGRPLWIQTRQTIQSLLSKDNPTLQNNTELREKAFVKQSDATMHMPATIGDYTDFFSSKYHATNTGIMFRGVDNPLLPNWKHIPVGYHGRASSVVISGTSIHRPVGQILPPGAKFGECDPIFESSKTMDFELEMAFFVGGPPTKLGQRIDVKSADDHIFGMVLMNDWSARDIQKWEYQPLGPFTAKNLGTTISPWVVTMEALKQFIVPNMEQDPKPFDYLKHDDPYNFDIKLEIELKPKGGYPTVISRGNYRTLYWTSKQQLAHHTITGCNLNPGDLMATGTISGDSSDSFGSMLELSWMGSKPVNLKGGQQRKFLQDFDTVTLRGYCENDKDERIGFGECVGTLLPVIQ
ncbi:fumarylacetoacetate hydrolase [Arctopsyche grandis]|uniref:fumarylacetoacetate hydrolase n=1 Tax=Arctopsyche grandis TaxID=121162 RepID=UPI00406D9885